jgi:hypothetical protein
MHPWIERSRQVITASPARLAITAIAVLCFFGLCGWGVYAQFSKSDTRPTVSADDSSLSKYSANQGQTVCFSVKLADGMAAKSASSCNLLVSSSAGSITIKPLIGEGKTLATHANLWKQVADHSRYTIVSEDTVKIGGNQSVRFVYKRSKNDQNQALWLVAAASKYKVNSKMTDGFEIAGSYYGDSKTAAETLLKSLEWK